MTTRFLVPLTILTAATSCGPDQNAEPREVTPVYEEFANYSHTNTLSPEAGALLAVVGTDADTWSESQAVKVFTPDVDSVFAQGLQPLEQGIANIYAKADSEGLNLPDYRFGAVVWGRPESIIFCDSVALIALNHYLGAEYPGYSHLEPYRRRYKTPDRIVLDLAEALVATAYPYSAASEDATVLSRQLYEGALAEARIRLTGSSDAAALGYTKDEYQTLLNREQDMWRTLVAHDLLYSTRPLDAERLLAPAPSTAVLVAPARAGRFIGLQIVRAYLKANPETPLSQLLSPAFYASDATLRDSRYTGR